MYCPIIESVPKDDEEETVKKFRRKSLSDSCVSLSQVFSFSLLLNQSRDMSDERKREQKDLRL